MVVSIDRVAPVAHLPLVLGVLRKLDVAGLIDALIVPHPEQVVSAGRAAEALVLSILDGHHALYKVGRRLDERGMLELLEPGLEPPSLHDTRLGQSLDALFAANLNEVFSAIALRALETYQVETPWMHQDTTTIGLYGAYESARESAQEPRPAYGYSKDGRGDLKQVLLSLGVSGDGGLPLRMGLHDGNTSDTVDVPRAIEQSVALNLDGLQGLVADSKAYTQRTLGLCLETGMGLVTLVPRTCSIRQEVEAWGQRQASLPLLLERPAKRQGDGPRRWYGHSVRREVEVEDQEGHVSLAPIRFIALYSTQLAQQHEQSYRQAQAREAQALATHIAQVQSRAFACEADAQGAIAEYEGKRPGRRGVGEPRHLGAIMRFTTTFRRIISAKNERGAVVHAKMKRLKKKWGITCVSRPRPARQRVKPMAGWFWPPPSMNSVVVMPRLSKPTAIKRQRWSAAFVGSKIPPPSARCGWKNPSALRR